MKILLSDASGLTSRQIATILSRKGHVVHVLAPPGITLTKVTRHVAHVHRVPPFGVDPYDWLNSTLSIISNENRARKGAFDVLICTQEQVAVLSAETDSVRKLGLKIAVPAFASLRRAMDKISACEPLREAGLGQPESVIISAVSDLKDSDIFPAYAKLPIATGSTGVRRVSDIQELESACRSWRIFDSGGKVLLQKAIPGPLLMICGIFSHGKLVAWHSCLRAREGVNGGASKKVSLPLPIIGTELERLGKELDWHGALSMDAILLDGKPMYIDVNPRIVEPMNALLSGVDLVGALLDVSLSMENLDTSGKEKVVPKPGKEGVTTHQLILALLAAAKEGRISLVREVWMVIRGWKGYYGYKGSVEELTPVEGDWWSVLVLVVLVNLLLVGGRRMVERLSGQTVKNYAVSPQGWEGICRREDEKGRATQINE